MGASLAFIARTMVWKPGMRNTLTVLGCGTSGGVPFICCDCAVCRSKNPKNKRTRSSVWIQVNGKSFVIDTGPDFRNQCLREKIRHIDAVLYTHPHADHVHGIDELRSFNFFQKGAIPVYGNAWICRDLPIKFSYIFRSSYAEPEGGGIPTLTLHEIRPSIKSIKIQGVPVIPIPHMHGSNDSLGYRIDSVAYIADCSYIPEASLKKLKGLSVLVLDCLRIRPHRTHLNLDQALKIVEAVKPKRTYLTHLGHEFDYAEWKKKLPKGVSLAYDGLKVQF
jgi:phosphoribosyl 1,2-cyclic phosphate phosphodiesterase